MSSKEGNIFPTTNSVIADITDEVTFTNKKDI
jgi:hypothetical protein